MIMLKSTHKNIVDGFESQTKGLESRIATLHDLKNINTEFFENKIEKIKETLKLPEDELKLKILELEDENKELKKKIGSQYRYNQRSMAQTQLSQALGFGQAQAGLWGRGSLEQRLRQGY